MRLHPVARPANAVNKELTFSSADEEIATVDANGLITGLKAGTTTITTAGVEDPNAKPDFTLTVINMDGPQSVAHTISAQKDALISFKPEHPAQRLKS